MASDECQGKGSWPELVGVKGEVAKATIERENPLVNAVIVVEGEDNVITNYQCDRVWVWVDKAGIVVSVPIIG
ncbi:Proteinase inhibitor I13, potato inhibitor I [Corchorus capsularis]|uniref:Proteinase inhibitor I13, potato inhibitor I n=1 Tax=Corchorus capsularis TaxID=210143 RepID=A0A1R3JMQ8_COCAP|nr:Proteinase inhibitor I13, potato inhibitor I [Corchorus capsularis]